jgi:hypothetical protein
VKPRVIPILLLALCLPPCAFAQELLFVRPWCELEPFVRIGPQEYPLSNEDAQRRVLEEARTLFSAMVYGYTFLYTPSDAARKVGEVFTLTPVAEVPWGSGAVKVVESVGEGTKLYARLSYALSVPEARRRASWDSSAVAMSTGSGEGSLFNGYTEKIAALDNAIKNAIKNHLNTRVLNKPREIRGEVVLWEDPQTVTRAGVYLTTAKVRLRVTEIVSYRIF